MLWFCLTKIVPNTLVQNFLNNNKREPQKRKKIEDQISGNPASFYLLLVNSTGTLYHCSFSY